MKTKSMACPRCHAAMSARTAAVQPEASPVTADLCPQCNGLWFDGAELGDVSAALGGLPRRSAEIAEKGEKSAIHCPRCNSAMREVALLDVPIDVCAGCSGVWLDGGEYEALSRAADLGEGLSPPPIPAGRDRSAAVRARQTQQIRCAKCSAVTALEKTYMTERGQVCADCYLGGEREAMDKRAHTGDSEFASYVRQPSPYEGPSGPSTQLTTGAAVIVGVLGVLLDSARCRHCGCRTSSHCRH